jgi:N-acyl-phosphatidylethanolamine-hydrolysing phospholipase D
VRPLARPILLVVLGTTCVAAGTEPTHGEPAHHLEGGFRNTDSAVQRASAAARFKFMLGRALASERSIEVPREANDGAALRANGADPTVTWIGHATMLVQLQGTNLLTDPHWGARASPVSWAGPKRLQPPGLAFESLPPIHVVLISHDHYDHLDLGTVRRLAASHDPVFLVPLGLKAWFEEQGISRVVELDWWGVMEHRGLRIVCTPAQHFSQRRLWDADTRLWASWAVVGSDRRFYFSGDTGYFDGLREIGERLGPFDLTALAIGAYMPPSIMRFIHLTPEQAVHAHRDLRGTTLVGIHWGTFDLAEEPLEEPPARMLAEASRRGLPPERAWILKLGETRRW